MALRNIITLEDPILRKTSRKVESFDQRLWTLLDDMKETLYFSEGVGLAAPQVGVLRRVIVMDAGDGYIELINPEIISQEGEQESAEACLSVPEKAGITKRPETVRVKAQNRNGDWCVYRGDGLKAKCFCHEIDHLNGILFIDKMIRECDREEY